MRNLLFLLLLFLFQAVFSQEQISGVVTSSLTGEPLPFASVQLSEGRGTLTDIRGTFSITPVTKDQKLVISYVGYSTSEIALSPEKRFYEIKLIPSEEKLDQVMIYSGDDPAKEIIREAISKKSSNDPEKKLSSFKYKSYNKFLIDNQEKAIEVTTDTANLEVETVVNVGRAFLSEKVSTHLFRKPNLETQIVEGIKTAGFKEPVYDLLALHVEPLSLYNEDYQIFETDYASPLGDEALQNYNFRILDTLKNQERPSYVIYFKPKRERVVAGLEGILFLDTVSLAIQKAKAQLIGAIELEINHNYTYFEQEDIWFPSDQSITLKPGEGGKDISVFGGSISVGTVQRENSMFNKVLSSGEIEDNLFLSSTTKNYEIQLNVPVEEEGFLPSIYVSEEAEDQPEVFWEENRQEPFTAKDLRTAQRVDSILRARNIERKIRVKNAISSGHYPLGFVDVDLGEVYSSSTLEGLRLGIGGATNDLFSEEFRIHGYVAYGFDDKKIKHGVGLGALLHHASGTWFNLYQSRDIREMGSFEYIQGLRQFFLLSPRNSDIDKFYAYETYQTSLTHKIIPSLNTELALSRNDISQHTDYRFFNNGILYDDYQISEATFGFLWRPFSEFLFTPEDYQEIEKGFPYFTGQITQSFKGLLGGEFNFTKVGLKINYEINRLDLSKTQFILEGNLGFGNIPLTHLFHASPNNPNKPGIFERVDVAGSTIFETMYFNEFFSRKQVSLNLRHQLRPWRITKNIRPELVFVSRHIVGDLDNMQVHRNITFNTLDKGYHEAGLELNNILFGFGIGVFYRYGPYHLPTFKENLALKYTFELSL